VLEKWAGLPQENYTPELPRNLPRLSRLFARKRQRKNRLCEPKGVSWVLLQYIDEVKKERKQKMKKI
jgi:hypothetical protein